MPTTHTPRKILVTGGSGFIGSNYVRWALQNDSTIKVVNLDALTYAGNRSSLLDVERDYPDRYRFVHGSICDQDSVKTAIAGCDTLINFAAESHVDRSIDGPGAFLDTNIMGTFRLLDAARAEWSGAKDVRFHQVSTDEVFGSLGATGFFHEDSIYDPSSPYSASKASADHIVRAWHRTFGLPVTISNCSNNYGPFQFPEKLIPLMISKALRQEALPVYGDGQNIRDWLYVTDHCVAIDRVVRAAKTGSTYLIGGHNEWKNLDIVHTLCDLVDELRPAAASRRELVTFVKDRPGHDDRYAIDASRIQKDLGWTPAETFETGIRKTVQWYLDNQAWTGAILDGTYKLERLG